MLGRLVDTCCNEISYFLLSWTLGISLANIVGTAYVIHSMQGTPWEYTYFTLSASSTNISESIQVPSSFTFTFNDTAKYPAGHNVTRGAFEFAKLYAFYNLAAAVVLAIWAAFQLYMRHILPAPVAAQTHVLNPSFERQLRCLNLIVCISCIVIGLLAAISNMFLTTADEHYMTSSLTGLFAAATGIAMVYMWHYCPACDALKNNAMDHRPGKDGQTSSGTDAVHSSAPVAE